MAPRYAPRVSRSGTTTGGTILAALFGVLLGLGVFRCQDLQEPLVNRIEVWMRDAL